MIYLASPYSHPDPAVRHGRFREACRAAGRLMHGGATVFSPIAHSHPIAVECGLPLAFEWWERADREWIAMCSEVVVLRLDGWEQSNGIRCEVAIAAELGIPVRYIDP